MRLRRWSPLALALVLPVSDPPAPPAPTPARAVYDRFKALEGVWKGESTKGWVEDVSFRLIAAGSAVLETSFDAHPNETMLTLISMDGEKLRLVHYCVAKNQPRLEATSFDADGRGVTFTFLDGGNLPSREHGHMDKATFRFEDADHVTTRWTWYQNGQERWLEEIKLTRKK
ncbi:MAG TPA: hypothetical protein VIB08_09640 [Thermoanaerobaculia bacterium]|jgi:hypothetical protein